VPYVDVHGATDGPHLTVVAGVHGTEYTSIAAVREFVRALDPATFAGRIAAVPVMNLAAFWHGRRSWCPSTARTSTGAFPVTSAEPTPTCSA
jgi:predicted deacylase